MNNQTTAKVVGRIRRHARVRSKIKGTAKVPRLSIFRSNSALYAQLIDDQKGATIASASGLSIKGTKQEKAVAVGKEIAKKAIEHKIKTVVFDRGGFRYAGNVKALADGAREGGLTF